MRAEPRSAWTTCRCRCGLRSSASRRDHAPLSLAAALRAADGGGADEHSCGSPAAPSTTPPTASTARCATSASTTAASSPSCHRSAPRLDARGMVVMPGGVDIHCHVASGAVNVARRLLPEEHAGRSRARSSAGRWDRSRARAPAAPSRARSRPATATRGSATRPCSTPPSRRSLARLAHAELDDTPIVDGGFFVLLGNDEYLLRLIDAGERERAREYAAWLLGAAGGYAIKVVNPGGVELWKRGRRERTQLDTPFGSSRVTPRAILETLVDAAVELGLPHAAHIHCNNLGVPGNVATTLDTCARSTGVARTSRTCSFTATAARRRWLALRRARGHRVRQCAPVDHRRRRPGDVRRRRDAHRRCAGRVPAAPQQRAEVGERRHRARDRLRHRALTSTRTQCGRGAAVGDRARAVPARERSVARRAVHRPPERRLVHVVPGADPTADGSCLSRRAAAKASSRSCSPAARSRMACRASTRSTRSRSSRAPGRRAFSGCGTRGTWASARTPTSRCTRLTRTAPRCSRRRDSS